MTPEQEAVRQAAVAAIRGLAPSRYAKWSLDGLAASFHLKDAPLSLEEIDAAETKINDAFAQDPTAAFAALVNPLNAIFSFAKSVV